jgi:hypothetical protein
MKKLLSLIIFLLPQTMSAFSLFSISDHASRSFMFPRPGLHNLAMQQAMWHDYIYNRKGQVSGSLQAYSFYQHSVDLDCCDESNKFAGYFLPDCMQTLLVAGDSAGFNNTRDVRSEWLDIPNPAFSGNLSIMPEQKQYGVVLEYHQDLHRFLSPSLFDTFWFSVTVPFVATKNNLHLRQTNVMNPGTTPGFPANIVEAFDQPNWRYDKICGEQKKSGLSEVKLKFGAVLLAHNGFEVDFYEALSIPLHGKANPAFLFSPFIGNNRHWTIGSGVNFQFPISSKDASFPLLFFLNAEHQFLIRNSQLRTFDLRDKPWSRFLLLNAADGSTTNVPGVNVLTRRVTVRPDSFVDLSTGLRVTRGGFEGEIGYDLWAHRGERIKLHRTICKKCNEEVVVSDFGIAGSGQGKSASGSNIKTLAPDDASFVVLHDWDLDLSSGAAGSALINRFHASLGFGSKGEDFEGFLNVGFFYDHPQNNGALKQWGGWAKVGASF